MKRTFLARRNGLLSPADLSWGFFAIAFALVALLVRLIAPNFFWYALTPAFHAADALALQSHLLISSFSDASALTAQNERLMQENAALVAENQALLQKAVATRDLPLGILAGVVARPPESPYDTLVLAAGTSAGVEPGQKAFGAGGVPLGIVSAVSDDFSRVTLFSAPDVVTSGWVGSASLPLSIKGAGAGVMGATASRSAAIAVGDTVFAPGPGQLPIGTVARIDSDPSSPVVTLRIKPALNLFSIAWVTLRDTGAGFSVSVATSTLP